MKMPGAAEPAYVAARRVLLDALDALTAHRSAIVLVGAQALYAQLGDSSLAVAPYTTDADLALDPELLLVEPRLAAAMNAGGFTADAAALRLGTWYAPNGIAVDLMVPDAVGGSGRRGARLGGHGNDVARKTRGLEAALIDNEVRSIGSLEAGDPRQIDVKVAGLTALLIAKLHKLNDRRGDNDRRSDKDALDIYRILQSAPTAALVTQVTRLESVAVARTVTMEAMELLDDLFGRTDRQGSVMVGRAVEPLMDAAEVATACAYLAQDLRMALRR